MSGRRFFILGMSTKVADYFTSCWLWEVLRLNVGRAASVTFWYCTFRLSCEAKCADVWWLVLVATAWLSRERICPPPGEMLLSLLEKRDA